MGYVLTVGVELETVTCYNCGTVFAIDSNLIRKLKNSGQTFWCPNGHGQVFSNPVEKQLKEAQKNLKQAQENEAWWKGQAEDKAAELNQTRKTLATTRGQLTRTKNRVAKGICPCCNRQFVNLHRHMSSQHPEYNAPEETETHT